MPAATDEHRAAEAAAAAIFDLRAVGVVVAAKAHGLHVSTAPGDEGVTKTSPLVH
jgi:hypothetical protein